jgi:hypothetical protein
MSWVARVFKNKPTGRPHLPINDSAFDVITPEAEYWVGVLCADGCIQHRPNRQASIDLRMKDREHVEKFAAFIGVDPERIGLQDGCFY